MLVPPDLDRPANQGRRRWDKGPPGPNRGGAAGSCFKGQNSEFRVLISGQGWRSWLLRLKVLIQIRDAALLIAQVNKRAFLRLVLVQCDRILMISGRSTLSVQSAECILHILRPIAFPPPLQHLTFSTVRLKIGPLPTNWGMTRAGQGVWLERWNRIMIFGFGSFCR